MKMANLRNLTFTTCIAILFRPAAATAQGFRLISGDTIDAITAPVAGNVTTDATESALQIPPADPRKFYLLTYP